MAFFIIHIFRFYNNNVIIVIDKCGDIMKKKSIIFFLIIFLFALSSCKEDEPINNPTDDPPTPVDVDPDPVEEFTDLFKDTYIDIYDMESVDIRSLTTIDLDEVEFSVTNDKVVSLIDGKLVPNNAGYCELWGTYDYESYYLEVYVMPIVECDLCDQDEVVYVGNSTNLIIANYDGKFSDFDIVSTNDNIEIKGSNIKFVKPGNVDIAIYYKDDPRINTRLSFSVKKTKPILTVDNQSPDVDDYVLFGVSNYASIEMFDISLSDSSILELDSEYYGLALKPGKVTVTIRLKDDPEVADTIEVTVKNIEIKARLSYKRIIVGDEFSVDLYSYSSEDVFDFYLSDESVVSKIGKGRYKALKVGECKLVVSLKSDSNTKYEVDFTVYPVEPVIQVGPSFIQVGQTSKIILANYVDLSEFDVTFNDDSLVSLSDDNFTALKTGNLVITVTKKSDPSVTSKVSIEIIPVQPNVYLSSEYIKVGGTSGIYISNLSDINEESIDDFNIEVETKGIISLDDYTITGLKEGETKIILTSKVDSKTKGEVKVVVTKTSTEVDNNGEPNSGVLLLSIKDNSNAYLSAGDFYQIFIDGAADREHFRWITTDALVAVVNDTGRVIAVNSGVCQIAAINKLNNEVKGTITVTVYGIPNVDYAARLVRVATEELGYREGPNNDTKYGAWYNLNYEAWCAMFVSWCCNQAGISTDIVPKYCGCTAGMNWFIERGRFQYRESGYIPKAGDIAFYRDRDVTSWTSTHTGIVYAATATTVYTIEGNTSDMCAKRSYSLNSTYILGYGVPDYPEFDGEPATFTPGRPENGENYSTR